MASLMKRNTSYGYTKMEREDPQERSHREAQFLIYKKLKQADQIAMQRSSSSLSWLRLRICKLKVRIGKRLLKLRKITILSSANMAKSKVGVCKNVMGHFKSLKRLLSGGGSGGRSGGAAAIRRLPRPLLA